MTACWHYRLAYAESFGVTVKQMDKGLQKGKDSYFASVKLAAQGLESQRGPWVVAEGVAPGLFEMWSAKQESRWKLAYKDEGGIILLYEDPSPVHEGTSGVIAQLILLELMRAGGLDAGGKAMRLLRTPICQLVNSRKQPDFKPKDCKQYSPTLVCELAYQNESMEELRRELSRWTAREDLAQMCFGVFINTKTGGAALDQWYGRVMAVGNNSSVLAKGQCVELPICHSSSLNFHFTSCLCEVVL